MRARFAVVGPLAVLATAARIASGAGVQATAFPPDVPIAPVTVRVDEAHLPSSVTATRDGEGVWTAEFTFKPTSPARSVALAGSFNGWGTQIEPMRRGDDAMWRTSVELLDGKHLYKFVVDGDQWTPDPRNPTKEDDGHGGSNSVLQLGGTASLQGVKAKLGDGKVEGAGLLHDPAAASDAQMGGAPGVVRLRLRTLRGDAQRASVVMERATTPMLADGAEGAFDWWVASQSLSPGDRYTFVVGDGKKEYRMEQVFESQDVTARAVRTPDWAKDAVWYQVMVDRFRNGDTASDPPQASPWTSEWYRPHGDEGKNGQTFFNWYVYSRLYGGDFQGLREKLPYLKELGVNAIYLNPVFQATTHHKYNATTYLHIDEGYGASGDYLDVESREDLRDPSTWEWTRADRVFLDFLKDAKAQGFRVILDGVFNHVGTAHPAFKDVRSRKQESPYADWFTIRSWEPFEYDGWAGFGELPAFKKDGDGLASESLKKHIFDATRRWMDPDGDGDPSDGIDGWRLDVPMELPMGFWYEWCNFVRSINPNAYIVGEVWQRADSWLDGRSFDAVMNYPFASAIRLWAGRGEHKIPTSAMDQRLAEIRRAYAPEVGLVLQNLVDSHDTDRIASQLKNLNPQFDAGNREQENPKYDGRKPDATTFARQRLIALAQMTYLGAPMIYYGDEVGMWGADDPTNRKPMLWKDLEPYENPGENRVMDDHLGFYRRAVALRVAEAALRRGDYRTLLADDRDDVWAFERSIPGGDTLVVILNASDRAQSVDLRDSLGDGASASWSHVFATDADAKPQSLPRLTVPAVSGIVFKRAR
ncbi:MAG: alpha-amylase family glycosyl hydrolase [Planctomycetota bacterium]|nr:alpha-amylase family glycosyl hydrolase [Planctomycetota bacterium]MDA1105639.1 alpha-amylase family glycosyl hydrolase [Planctomycetota bacterium]